MNKKLAALACIVVLCSSFLAQSPTEAGSFQGKAPTIKYDPKRDAETDIQRAIADARRTGKRILLEVGGDWCSWCHTMDRYFEQNAKLLEYRELHYVTLKINFSRENENKKVLARYPEIPGFPHIFVLDKDGKLLHSQNTGELESGKSYDLKKFMAFLEKWAPHE